MATIVTGRMLENERGDLAVIVGVDGNRVLALVDRTGGNTHSAVLRARGLLKEWRPLRLCTRFELDECTTRFYAGG